ncbi:MAG: 30S ribosomal protein S16 [Cytophagaceae bacterium]
MPVKIRLTRRGRKKKPLYDIIVADSRAPRDGKFIEKLGNYNPNTNPAIIDLDVEKAFQWVMNGAVPTDTARNILSVEGVLLKKHLQIGVNKGAISQEQADKKLADWKAQKEKSFTSQQEELLSKKETAKKERLAAEAKVNEARKEALKAKQSEFAAAMESADAKAEEAADVANAVETEEAPVAAATETIEEKIQEEPQATAETPIEAIEDKAEEEKKKSEEGE